MLAQQKAMEQYQALISSLPTICLEEVKKHKSKDDVWTVVEGIVYDVTQYAPIHPGGKKIMLGAGKESTEMFHKYHKGVIIG
jgi:cytochrome b involved in lipid metabolism